VAFKNQKHRGSFYLGLAVCFYEKYYTFAPPLRKATGGLTKG
jgi:hypothetical protein